jgi:TPR repeat protein
MTFLSLVMWCGSGVAAPVAQNVAFPGYPETRHIRALKTKADRLYQAGDFARAHRIYRSRLAFYGDKYAQYMAGYQYLHGQGVERDLSLALAWYQLAAQRGDAALLKARDALAAVLTAEQRRLADMQFRELDAVHGDVRILQRLIFRDRLRARQRTGSRIGANNGPLTIIGPDGIAMDGDQYYQDLKAQMALRLAVLQTLKGRIEYGDLDVTEPD